MIPQTFRASKSASFKCTHFEVKQNDLLPSRSVHSVSSPSAGVVPAAAFLDFGGMIDGKLRADYSPERSSTLSNTYSGKWLEHRTCGKADSRLLDDKFKTGPNVLCMNGFVRCGLFVGCSRRKILLVFGNNNSSWWWKDRWESDGFSLTKNRDFAYETHAHLLLPSGSHHNVNNK